MVPDGLHLLKLTATPGQYDCSHWGRMAIRGADRLRFLHNQSSNNLNILKPGQGCDTVILTSTARTIDLVTAWVKADEIILLVSPERREFLLKWLDKYIFFGDQVELVDLTEKTSCWRLVGPGVAAIFHNLGIDLSGLNQLGDHQDVQINDCEITLGLGSGLAIPGFTVMGTVENAEKIESVLTSQFQALSNSDWEQLRILQGRPAVDYELTDDYNPLEARLERMISFDKGCYIGQETIARLNTYQGTKQYLWGLELTDYVEPGTPLVLDGQKVGVLTSCTLLPQSESEPIKAFGLGYLKTKAGGPGLEVLVNSAKAQVVDVPFLRSEVNHA